MITRRMAVAGIGAAALAPLWAARAAAADDAPAVVPIAVQGSRVLVAIGIDGQGPFFFLIDTGGTVSLIDTALARQLQLPIVARTVLSGAGGKQSAAIYKASEVLIGAVVRERDLAFNGVEGFGFGKDIRGTLAAGALTAYDSVLDFDHGEWRIYPHGLPDLPGFTAIDSSIGHPARSGSAYAYATAAIDGQSYRFLLDTAAPAAVRLYPEAVRRSGLWDDPERPYAPVRRGGIGGAGPVDRLVRARMLNLGGIAFDAPLVLLDGGARGQRVADGVIGFEILRQLNIATDVRRRRLLVERNHQLPPPPVYPLAGIWIDQKGDALVAADVGRGSPAAAAGIAPGDRIVGQTLASVVHQLGGPPGSSVPLTIEHDGARRNVTLMLRRYL
jgi:serine protease Do